MKVARLYAPGDLRIEDAPVPEAGPGDIVIRVRSCATCGTDAKVFRHGHHHISLPRVLGHEIAGEVSEVGPEVEQWSPGDPVQVIAAIPDGVCYYCRRGQQTVCENLESIGYQYDGAFAEFMRVPRKVLDVEGVNRIPEGVPFEAASLTEPLACVLNGQEIAEVPTVWIDQDGSRVDPVTRAITVRAHIENADREYADRLVRLRKVGLGLGCRGCEQQGQGDAKQDHRAIVDAPDGRAKDGRRARTARSLQFLVRRPGALHVERDAPALARRTARPKVRTWSRCPTSSE